MKIKDCKAGTIVAVSKYHVYDLFKDVSNTYGIISTIRKSYYSEYAYRKTIDPTTMKLTNLKVEVARYEVNVSLTSGDIVSAYPEDLRIANLEELI